MHRTVFFFKFYKFKNIALALFLTGNLEGFVKKGLLTHEKMKSALSILKGVLDYSEFIDVDMVIEVILQTRIYIIKIIFSCFL